MLSSGRRVADRRVSVCAIAHRLPTNPEAGRRSPVLQLFSGGRQKQCRPENNQTCPVHCHSAWSRIRAVTLSYRRHRFPLVVIQHAVWLYLRFTLSYRDVEDLLVERGLDISYERGAELGHEGGSSGMPTVGIDRFESRAARHIVSHTMEMMLACLAVIWGGVCERHPKIRIAFLESGGGWIAPWLDRMDRHFDDQFFNNSGLKTRPSELFQRNCWISFEPVETSLQVLADFIGPNKILWATDYPHPDGFFPGAPEMVRERLKGTSPATQHGVLAGGAMAFYGLN